MRRPRHVLLVIVAALASACAATPRPPTPADENRIPLVVTPTGPDRRLADVDLLVDGTPARFLLDTGAAVSSVANDAWAKRYPTLGPDTSTGVSGRPEPCDVIQPNEIRLASHRFAAPRITRCDRNILGIDLLGTVVFQVDLAARALRILPSFPRDGPRHPLRTLRRGHVTVPLALGDQRVWGLIDTGADTTVIDSAFVDRHPEAFTLARTEPGTDAHGHAVESKVFRCREVDVGPLKLNDVEVAAFDFGDYLRSRMEGAPLIVGNDVIGHARWTFDVAGGAWSATPTDESSR